MSLLRLFFTVIFLYIFLGLIVWLKTAIVPVIIIMVWVFRKRLLIIWKKNACLRKRIKRKEFFFITDKNYKTDLYQRRQYGGIIYWFTNISFILINLLVVFIHSFLPEIKYLDYILDAALFLALLGIFLAVKNYFIGIYYYFIPVFLFLCFNGSKYNLITMVFVLCVTSLAYLLFVIITPLYLLRKITNQTWFLSILITLSFSLLFKYYFPVWVLERISDYKNIAILSDIGVDNFHLVSVAIMEKIAQDSLLSDVDKQVSIFEFLIFGGYSIGIILIKLKIKLGESKAKEIFKQIKSDVNNVNYELLRDCVFYGGEKYEEKIMDNENFERIIFIHENEKDFYKPSSKIMRAYYYLYEKIPYWLKKLI